jgi:foldase protein PrsA
MQFLISSQWVQREAADQGIKISSAEVQSHFNASKKQAFPTQKAFQQFLQSSGMTQADLLFRVRVDQLSTKLRNKVSKRAKPVTAAEIASYYRSHASQFGTPEKRDLLVVLTKTQAQAQKALGQLRSGQSFATVAKQMSIDADSKAHGGLLAGVIKGQEDRNLDAAAFSAPKGKLQGPIKTAFGYYVFEVKSITKGNQQSLKQATSAIRSILTAQTQQKVLTSFITTFQKKWRAKTDCRSGFVNPDCKNAPKTTSTATAPPGAVPQNTQTVRPAPSGGGSTTGK